MKYYNGSAMFIRHSLKDKPYFVNYYYNFYVTDAITKNPLCIVNIVHANNDTSQMYDDYYLFTLYETGTLNMIKYTLEADGEGNLPLWDFPITTEPTNKNIKVLNINNINCNNFYGTGNRIALGIKDSADINNFSTDLPVYKYTWVGSNMPEDLCNKFKNDMIRYFVNGDTSTAENYEDLEGNHIDFNVYYNSNTEIFTIVSSVRSGEAEPPYTFIGGPNTPESQATKVKFTDRFESTLSSLGASDLNTSMIVGITNEEGTTENNFYVYGYIVRDSTPPFERRQQISKNGRYRIFFHEDDPPNEHYPDNADPSDTVDDTNDFEGHTVLTTTYMLDEGELKAIGNKVWNPSFFDTILKNSSSPIENIVSVKAIPASQTGTRTLVKIGNYDSEVSAVKCKNVVKYEDVAKGSIVGKYNNFLDLSPYTKCYLYLPFVGIYEIQTSMYYNHKIKIDAIIDFTVGTIEYAIKINSKEKPKNYYVVDTVGGEIGIDIPLSANNRAQNQASIISNYANSLINLSPQQFLSSIVSSFTDVAHTSKSSMPSASNGSLMPSSIYIIYVRPDAYTPRTYGRQIGYLWMQTANIGKLSGFTILENPDLSNIPNILKSERDRLYEILTTGFYA